MSEEKKAIQVPDTLEGQLRFLAVHLAAAAVQEMVDPDDETGSISIHQSSATLGAAAAECTQAALAIRQDADMRAVRAAQIQHAQNNCNHEMIAHPDGARCDRCGISGEELARRGEKIVQLPGRGEDS